MTHAPAVTVDARSIIDALGRDRVAEALGVSPSSVGMAASTKVNQMPANWYLIVAALCLAHGVPCSPDAFAFRGREGAE